MGRARKVSGCDLYHITSRGVGGQIIFEDDNDRRHFLALLKSACTDHGLKVAAWCLMENHFHLLVMGELRQISAAMKYLKETYAKDLNKRHSRVGSVFQGVFSSFPIEDESYMATAVRYIHNNPVRAGIVECARDYHWSSYQEYCGKRFLLSESLMLPLGDDRHDSIDFRDPGPIPRRALYLGKQLSDEEAISEAKLVLNVDSPTIVKSYDSSKRSQAIKKLYEHGLNKSQIARATGVCKATVAKTLG